VTSGKVVVASLMLLVLMAGCGSDGDTSAVGGPQLAPTTTVAAQPVVREILAQTQDPPGAPGRTLTLARYTIAPGAKLNPHIHPGVQMASIVEGTLTYHVLVGTVTVQRDVQPDGTPTSTETLTAPAQTTLGPGDVVVELDGMEHYGENLTDEPIVILASLLTEDGKDLAVTVTTTAGQ
jgi:quercetin dioxygenase-like cupin family protein